MNNVLYVEDEPDDVFFLQRAFSDAGITNALSVVTDGMAAIDYLSGAGIYSDRVNHPQPCLAILDLNLPGRSGIEILKWIRNSQACRRLPVIMLTSSFKESDIHRAYDEGANSFLVKPSNPVALLLMAKAIKDYWLLHNRQPQ
jgi:CheY-like chemotaxis protein